MNDQGGMCPDTAYTCDNVFCAPSFYNTLNINTQYHVITLIGCVVDPLRSSYKES